MSIMMHTMNRWQLTQHSSLTGLPIMGAILERQGSMEYSGLIIFSGVGSIVGAALLVVATYLLGKKLGTWKV
jgi:hypothetical protein